MRSFTVAAVLAISTLSASAAFSAKPKMTGIFSTLSYSTEGGEMTGAEVFIVYGGGPYFAVVQCAAGRLGAPVVVPAIIDPPNVSFTLPKGNEANCPEGEVRGEISQRGLRASMNDREWPPFLARRKSYWQ